MKKKRNPADFNPNYYRNKKIGQAWFLELFELCDAVWLHDGNPKKPHAELSGGKCSNGFFDIMRVTKYPNLNEILAYQLVERLYQELGSVIHDIGWVVGSPYAAITLSYEVAKILKAVHGFAEKDPDAPKKMVWRRLVIPEGAKVLQVEELTTTSRTFKEVCQAIEQGNPSPVNFLPEVGVLVHRPPELPVDYGDRRVVAVVEKEVWAVEPSECPLCKAGSPRLKPKTHWRELTGKS